MPAVQEPGIVSEAASAVPVFMMHGTQDKRVERDWTLSGYNALEKAGANVGHIEYTDLGHKLVGGVLSDLGDMVREMLFAADHGMQLLLSTATRAETIEPVSAPGVAPLSLEDLAPLSPQSAANAAAPVSDEPPLSVEDLAPLETSSTGALRRSSALFEENESMEALAPLVALQPAVAPLAGDAHLAVAAPDAVAPDAAAAPAGEVTAFCGDDSECGEGLTCYDEVCVKNFKKGEEGARCSTGDDCASRNCQFEMSWAQPFQCAAKKASGSMCTVDEVCSSSKCEWFKCK